MTATDLSKRRSRGSSPRGNFESAKMFATDSEEARIAANKQKTDNLREARLKKEELAGASS